MKKKGRGAQVSWPFAFLKRRATRAGRGDVTRVGGGGSAGVRRGGGWGSVVIIVVRLLILLV